MGLFNPNPPLNGFVVLATVARSPPGAHWPGVDKSRFQWTSACRAIPVEVETAAARGWNYFHIDHCVKERSRATPTWLNMNKFQLKSTHHSTNISAINWFSPWNISVLFWYRWLICNHKFLYSVDLKLVVMVKFTVYLPSKPNCNQHPDKL